MNEMLKLGTSRSGITSAGMVVCVDLLDVVVPGLGTGSVAC